MDNLPKLDFLDTGWSKIPFHKYNRYRVSRTGRGHAKSGKTEAARSYMEELKKFFQQMAQYEVNKWAEIDKKLMALYCTAKKDFDTKKIAKDAYLRDRNTQRDELNKLKESLKVGSVRTLKLGWQYFVFIGFLGIMELPLNYMAFKFTGEVVVATWAIAGVMMAALMGLAHAFGKGVKRWEYDCAKLFEKYMTVGAALIFVVLVLAVGQMRLAQVAEKIAGTHYPIDPFWVVVFYVCLNLAMFFIAGKYVYDKHRPISDEDEDMLNQAANKYTRIRKSHKDSERLFRMAEQRLSLIVACRENSFVQIRSNISILDSLFGNRYAVYRTSYLESTSDESKFPRDVKATLDAAKEIGDKLDWNCNQTLSNPTG